MIGDTIFCDGTVLEESNVAQLTLGVHHLGGQAQVGWNVEKSPFKRRRIHKHLNDINVLEDQLIGVDSLYFMALIEQFRKMKENKPDFQLTTPYLVSIIDKIF